MNRLLVQRQFVRFATTALSLLLLLASVSLATIYDFQNDGGEYNGTILGQNPIFVTGAVRSLPEFNNLYSTSNPKILDEFEVGSGDRASFRTQTGSFFSWENNSPTIPTWVNARDGFKFPAGTALGGHYSGASAGETVKFRAYSFPIGSGLYTEMDNLPFVAETSAVVAESGQLLSFRFDSLPADARSFAAFRTTSSGDYITAITGVQTSRLELTTAADTSPPPFPHSPTQFDFADVGISYPLGAFNIGDSGQAGLDNVNAAHNSSHGYHNEEFVIGHPTDLDPVPSFGIGGQSTAGYPDRYLTLQGREDRVNFWVNAKDGFMFPQDGAIGVGQYNPNFTASENGGVPVEVIIRAYAEPIQTGSFTELAGLTLVGEARSAGTATFNNPPILELLANARSFTVHTGDGNGNFKSYFSAVTSSYAWTTLNQIFVDTVVDTEAGLPGDYNGDNTVDAADYTIYRNSVGQSTLTNRGPGITGPVGPADYAVWKTHFGESGGGGASSLTMSNVPEPATVALLAIVALASTLTCRFRH